MARLKAIGLVVTLVVTLVAGVGCDLISDATSFTVCTDPETLTIDTAELGLTVSGTTIPPVSCSQSDVCSQAAAQLTCGGASYDCEITCGSTQQCEVVATAWHFADIDLSTKIKSKLQSQAISKVTLESVKYAVSQNTLNFRTPEISVYLGPTSLTQPGPDATLFVKLPPISAGQTTEGSLTPTSQGQSTLTNYIKNYTTPFRILGEAELIFPSGSPIPAGAVTAAVTTCFKISPL